MTEYINREYAKELFDQYGAMEDALALINTIPAADVAEVRHGRWKNGICTDCGFDIRCLTDGENDLEEWVWEGLDYCPNCGALMREDDNGKE